MTLLIISLLMGMVLGQRFKVLVLVPAMVFVLLVAIGEGTARAEGLWPTALLAMVAIASLQIGYLAGTGIRYLHVAARTNRHRTGFQGGPQPVDGSARLPAL
jgi:hypothetical protein